MGFGSKPIGNTDRGPSALKDAGGKGGGGKNAAAGTKTASKKKSKGSTNRGGGVGGAVLLVGAIGAGVRSGRYITLRHRYRGNQLQSMF